MIIGSGSIANAIINSKHFCDNNEIIVYAKGVPNFNETNLLNFKREKNELINLSKKYPEKKIIYFSTQSVLSNNNNDYINHKIYIEKFIIRKLFKKFLILRLPNVISLNKNTLFYILYNGIKNNDCILVDNSVKKEILHVNEIPVLLNLLIELENETINIGFNRSIPIKLIVKILSEYLQKTPNITELSFKYNYKCDYTYFLKLIDGKYFYKFDLKALLLNNIF